MPRRLAQQWMTLSDLERLFHASRAISVVAELLVIFIVIIIIIIKMVFLQCCHTISWPLGTESACKNTRSHISQDLRGTDTFWDPSLIRDNHRKLPG